MYKDINLYIQLINYLSVKEYLDVYINYITQKIYSRGNNSKSCPNFAKTLGQIINLSLV